LKWGSSQLLSNQSRRLQCRNRRIALRRKTLNSQSFL
jgi:hypothetical protein